MMPGLLVRNGRRLLFKRFKIGVVREMQVNDLNSDTA
jgi:hypothetical protein